MRVSLCQSTIFVWRSADITWCIRGSSFSFGNIPNLIRNVQTAASSTKREKCSSFSVAPFTLIAPLFDQTYKWVYYTWKCCINLGNMLKVGRFDPSDEIQSHPQIEAILLFALTERIVVKVTSTRWITVTLNNDQHCADFYFVCVVPRDLHERGPPVLAGR